MRQLGGGAAPDATAVRPQSGPGEGQAAFLLDLNRCVGCGACVLACRMENRLPEHISWRRIVPFNLRRNPAGPTFHFSLACHHCQDPPCARGCPSGALTKGGDGLVRLHEDLCLGCRYCEMACPFGAPSFDEDRGVMTKCHLCFHRQEEGRAPACVSACPTRALRVLAPGKPREEEFGAAGAVPGFRDPGGAEPNLRMAPPGGGKREDLYRSLVEAALGKGAPLA